VKRILYIGNHLSRGGAYPSAAETMAPLLAPELALRLVSRRSNRAGRVLDVLVAILRYGRTEQPVWLDVYSTSNFYYALFAAWVCHLLGFRYGCVLHGGNLPARLHSSPGLCRFLFGRAQRLVAPSGYLQDAFGKAGYRACVIPNFVSIAHYPFRLRKTVRPRLLWVRAFDAIYNPQMAIRVLQRVLEDYPDAELCMVGPDKDGSRAACEALAMALGVQERVRFTGRLSKPEWIALAADYDLFINTTHIDNTPVSVVEAMALGLPVVSTCVGGIPFLLEHHHSGLLAPANDVEAFSQQVIALLQQPHLALLLSQEGRKKAESFAWEQVKPLWLKALEYPV
jgi:glycosyltransferase involved in cell wall biosynthesis